MAEATYDVSRELTRIENSLATLQNQTAEVQSRVSSMDNRVQHVQAELQQLRQDFLKMMQDQKREAEFQRATTELVRVRQEIQQNFGKYMEVRSNMIGVLQATDAKLVRQETISNVSEELMLAAPTYWLAPCLIAVSAWISNNQSLADRAIKEAMRRDPNKTSLCMALICRRNGREDTCFEWLSEYFKRQDPANFSDSTFTFVDAYINGVFGTDRRHLCEDYIHNWLDEIRGRSENFEAEQEETWRQFFQQYVSSTGSIYPNLKESVAEFGQIDSYLARVHASGPVEETFEKLNETTIDQTALKRNIDDRLVQLVNRFDDKEMPLRSEEEYLQAIKTYRGDVDKANSEILARKKAREERKMDLVERMAEIIGGKKTNSISERKTALSFLHEYVNRGYDRFLEENKSKFPQQVTMQVDGWQGRTADGSNVNNLYNDYQNHMNGLRAAELGRVNKNPQLPYFIGAGVAGLIGLVLLFFAPFLGVLGIIAAIGLVIGSFAAKKNMENTITQINQRYDNAIQVGMGKIQQITTEWLGAKNKVISFESREKKKLVA